jgi:hypothetical protein
MQCAFCRRLIHRLGAWKTSSGILYCSEFCAEVEAIEPNTNFEGNHRDIASYRARSK